MKDIQYLKSKAILLRRQQEREWKKKVGAGMKIRVTKCYLVQILNDEDDEQACEYVFCENKQQAENRGKEMREELKETDNE